LSRRFHVITGGPGAGKTSLVAALERHGVPVVHESARPVLRAAAAAGVDVDAWRRSSAFAEAMLAHDLDAHDRMRATTGPVVFDRGLPDILAFCRLEGVAPPPGLMQAIDRWRYAEPVFIAPPWPDIYTTDAERIQSPAEAEASYRMLLATYAACGYRLVELPRVPLQARLAFILERIGPLSSPAS
jgi:predicted ATPase